jgi:hypothetical protein
MDAGLSSWAKVSQNLTPLSDTIKGQVPVLLSSQGQSEEQVE